MNRIQTDIVCISDTKAKKRFVSGQPTVPINRGPAPLFLCKFEEVFILIFTPFWSVLGYAERLASTLMFKKKESKKENSTYRP